MAPSQRCCPIDGLAIAQLAWIRQGSATSRAKQPAGRAHTIQGCFGIQSFEGGCAASPWHRRRSGRRIAS
eukprot:7917614-Alexandrium_andersonii.AAC.1